MSACQCLPKVPKIELKRRWTGCGVLDIDPSVAKTWFQLEDTSRVSASQLVLGSACMQIDLSRKGTDEMFVAYKAFSTDVNNNVSFYWDDVFLQQPPGYYVGDVYFNDTYCFSMEFRIRRCEAVVVACMHEYETPCRKECDVIGELSPTGGACPEAPCIGVDVIETPTPNTLVCDVLPDNSIDCEDM